MRRRRYDEMDVWALYRWWNSEYSVWMTMFDCRTMRYGRKMELWILYRRKGSRGGYKVGWYWGRRRHAVRVWVVVRVWMTMTLVVIVVVFMFRRRMMMLWMMNGFGSRKGWWNTGHQWIAYWRGQKNKYTDQFFRMSLKLTDMDRMNRSLERQLHSGTMNP